MQTIENEIRAARVAALVQPRPDLGALVVTGSDRREWLNGLVTCDLKGKSAGEGAYGLAVGKTGKILAEVWVLFAEDHIALAVPEAKLALLREHFERHLIMEDVEVQGAEGRAWVAIHGPRAKDLVAEARALGADAAIVDATGQGEMVAALSAPGQGEALASALLARAGEAAARATEAGFEQLRVLRGVPRFGVDFDEHSMPQEASLERLAVSFAKGCYLGQEAVFMLEKRGHAKKRLMRLAVERPEEGEAKLAPGAEITLADGTVVGVVTSVAPAPEAGRERALGHVKYKHATPGAALVIGGRPAEALGLAGEV